MGYDIVFTTIQEVDLRFFILGASFHIMILRYLGVQELISYYGKKNNNLKLKRLRK